MPDPLDDEDVFKTVVSPESIQDTIEILEHSKDPYIHQLLDDLRKFKEKLERERDAGR